MVDKGFRDECRLDQVEIYKNIISHVLSHNFTSYKVTARFPRQIWLSFYFFTDNAGKQRFALFAFCETPQIMLLFSYKNIFKQLRVCLVAQNFYY